MQECNTYCFYVDVCLLGKLCNWDLCFGVGMWCIMYDVPKGRAKLLYRILSPLSHLYNSHISLCLSLFLISIIEKFIQLVSSFLDQHILQIFIEIFHSRYDRTLESHDSYISLSLFVSHLYNQSRYGESVGRWSHMTHISLSLSLFLIFIIVFCILCHGLTYLSISLSLSLCFSSL